MQKAQQHQEVPIMERNGKVLDMTQGKPVKMILAFAIPLFIGNIFQQLYNVADTAIIGNLLGVGGGWITGIILSIVGACLVVWIARKLFK